MADQTPPEAQTQPPVTVTQGVGSLWRSGGALLGAVFAVIVGYKAIIAAIDERIEVKLRDAQVLRDLATRVRPSLVFDEDARILVNAGGAELIDPDRLEITKGRHRFDITITTRSHHGVEPILQPLDDVYTIRTERGKGFTWVFHVESVEMIVTESSATSTGRPQRFRLELSPP